MNKRRKWPKRLLIVLITLIGITGISVGGWYASVTGSLSKVHTPHELTVGSGMKKALIIYQPSSNQTTANVTSELAQQLASSGFTVTINYPSEALTYDMDSYDVVAFGSPVYMGKVSPVLGRYVKSLSIERKQVLLYATGMNLDVTSELSSMAGWVDDSNSIDAIKLGMASPELVTWFINQWVNTTPSKHFTIYDPTSSGIDALTGATMT